MGGGMSIMEKRRENSRNGEWNGESKYIIKNQKYIIYLGEWLGFKLCRICISKTLQMI
jgi:hypothetical protein